MTAGYVQPTDIYFDDLDATGVVHNSRYAVLLERALIAYWTEKGWSTDRLRSKFDDTLLAVREFTVTYHVPITRAGPVKIHFWIDHLGRSSVVYGFRVLSDDESIVHAEGRRVQVKLDAATFRPAAITPELRTVAESLMHPAAA